MSKPKKHPLPPSPPEPPKKPLDPLPAGDEATPPPQGPPDTGGND